MVASQRLGLATGGGGGGGSGFATGGGGGGGGAAHRLGTRNEVRIALRDRERGGPVAGAPAEVERILYDRVAAVAQVARWLLRGGGRGEKRADNCRKSDEQSSLVRFHVSSPSRCLVGVLPIVFRSRAAPHSAVGGRWYTSSFALGSAGSRPALQSAVRLGRGEPRMIKSIIFRQG